MPLPIRCFSCGKVVARYETKIEKMLKEGKKYSSIFEELGIDRYCCRSVVMTSVDLNEILIKYKTLPREQQ